VLFIEKWQFQCLLHGFIFILALVDKVPSCCTFSSDYDFISSEFKYDLKVKLGGGQDLKFSFMPLCGFLIPQKVIFNLCLDGVVVIDSVLCMNSYKVHA
jgi:hypothetical protein